MLALPPDEQQLLSRVSQYLFYRGIIPVVVRSPSEALIHSRHSRFAVIILPDNDPVLIRKVRSAEGMNHGTPVIVISSAPILPDSTLHMLGTNEIQEAIHRTTNSEKLEADLISALNHVIGQSCHIGDPGMSMLPLPAVQTTWSTMTHYNSAALPTIPFHHLQGAGFPGPFQQSATISAPTEIPTRLSPTQMQVMTAANGSQIHEQMASCGSQQIQCGAVEQSATTEPCLSEPLTQLLSNPGPAPTLCTNSQENTEPVLPGIETLLNAIQVVEGGDLANIQGDATFSKFTALQSPQSEETRACKPTRSRKTRRSSASERQKLAMAAMSEAADFESLNDSKSPMPASLLAKKPYFLELDSYREALADDPNASSADRHNSKERHRRIRITKAAEFFKSVIPCMDPSMDKATAFYRTVYYMVFLRNALLKQDPPIIPKLHQTFIEEWGEVFNLKNRADKADGKQPNQN